MPSGVGSVAAKVRNKPRSSSSGLYKRRLGSGTKANTLSAGEGEAIPARCRSSHWKMGRRFLACHQMKEGTSGVRPGGSKSCCIVSSKIYAFDYVIMDRSGLHVNLSLFMLF
jgi:hypothetical protein